MVDAEKVQDCGVEVMYVDGVLGDVVAPIVGLAVSDSTFYPPAGHPD